MWADHFEELGTPSVSARYDNDFCIRIATSVKDILILASVSFWPLLII